uniref:Glycine rich superfamily member n=1 Tax=Rhipicephalus appendiculatus TaxID=34631 RepID=A0A131YGA3_RHIAP
MPVYRPGFYGYVPAFADNYGLGFAGVPLLGAYGYGPFGGVFGDSGVWGGFGGYGYGYPGFGVAWGPQVVGGFGAAPSVAGAAGVGASSSSAGSTAARGAGLRGVAGSSGSASVGGAGATLSKLS